MNLNKLVGGLEKREEELNEVSNVLVLSAMEVSKDCDLRSFSTCS